MKQFFCAALLAASLLLDCTAWAQLGDKSDAPGMRQVSIVPAEQIPPATPLRPEQALASFRLPAGYELEIVAADPLVQDPVAIAFGSDGRLWVVEMRGYLASLDGAGEDAPIGRVIVLTDDDGDGRYDRSQVFVDELVLPRALAVLEGGVLVGAPPELAFWRDTDGNGKADTRELVATDYGVKTDPKRPYLANPERAPNGLLWGFDNWIYSAAYTKRFRYVNGEWQTRPTSFRGQWGLSQDDYGRLFFNSNGDHLRVDLIPAEYLREASHRPDLFGTNVRAAVDQSVWPGRVTPGINRGYRPEMLRDGRLRAFTAACAPWVYRGDLLPELYGNVFVAEPAANLVRRSVLSAPAGHVTARNAYEQDEFITSTDERFRPVNFTTGPDGALYVVDMYRGVIEHRISSTSYLRKQSEERGLVHPQHLGRIYRVVPAGKRIPRTTPIGALKLEEWVDRLSHPNAWWRETAQSILVARGDRSVIAQLRGIVASGPNPVGRVHALCTLDGLGAADQDAVSTSLRDSSPLVRHAGLRVGESLLEGVGRQAFLSRVVELARDTVAEVAVQAILTAGRARDVSIDVAIADAVQHRAEDALVRDAYLAAAGGREQLVARALMAQWTSPDVGQRLLLSGLAEGTILGRDAATIELVLSLIADGAAREPEATTALLAGMAAGAKSLPRPVALPRLPRGWQQLRQNGVMREQLNLLEQKLSWPEKHAVLRENQAYPLSHDEVSRFVRGKELFAAVCAVCHQLDGRGLDGLAPPLADSEWVIGPEDRLIRIVLHGVRGPIKVLGRVHMGDMPGFGGLDDESVAAILTYVRRAWGHAGAPIDFKAVREARTVYASQTDAWSAEELLSSSQKVP